MKDGMFHALLEKQGDKLVHVGNVGVAQYKEFVKSLEEGQRVEVFFDVYMDDGSLGQLAKIHKCIRELANDTGAEFHDMKLEVKKRAGFCFKKEIDGEMYMYCKSFGHSSKKELNHIIETIILMGDELGMNFR